MKEREHKILNHPILGYFLLIFFVMIIAQVVSYIIDNMILAGIISGYAVTQTIAGAERTQATGIGFAIGTVLAIGLFYLWFRPAFDGMLKKKDLLNGLVLLAPFLIIHWIGSILSWVQFGTASVLLAFLRSSAPGFGEEAAFRGLGVANYMRRNPTEKGIIRILWLSSVIFGLVHVTNAIAGAPLSLSIGQAAYATGVGMVLGAVYLRTGNLWPSILGHMSLDFLELIRSDIGGAGGVISGTGVGDWITIIAGAAGIFWGLYLVRPAKRPEIVELWKNKWNN
ncbi:MAG: CPBP family intramembrane metalloprotease [Lachnospiraceae bacterium]|nr:CPBP family intramembrane metalloprotease [Lachnospiraceae bacterium]